MGFGIVLKHKLAQVLENFSKLENLIIRSRDPDLGRSSSLDSTSSETLLDTEEFEKIRNVFIHEITTQPQNPNFCFRTLQTRNKPVCEHDFLVLCTKMEGLFLTSTNFGLDLAFLSSLAKVNTISLRVLDLMSSKVTDAALRHVGSLANLEHVRLSGNRKLTDRGIVYLASLARLRNLDLSGCFFLTDACLLALWPILQKGRRDFVDFADKASINGGSRKGRGWCTPRTQASFPQGNIPQWADWIDYKWKHPPRHSLDPEFSNDALSILYLDFLPRMTTAGIEALSGSTMELVSLKGNDWLTENTIYWLKKLPLRFIGVASCRYIKHEWFLNWKQKAPGCFGELLQEIDVADCPLVSLELLDKYLHSAQILVAKNECWNSYKFKN